MSNNSDLQGKVRDEAECSERLKLLYVTSGFLAVRGKDRLLRC